MCGLVCEMCCLVVKNENAGTNVHRGGFIAEHGLNFLFIYCFYSLNSYRRVFVCLVGTWWSNSQTHRPRLLLL